MRKGTARFVELRSLDCALGLALPSLDSHRPTSRATWRYFSIIAGFEMHSAGMLRMSTSMDCFFIPVILLAVNYFLRAYIDRSLAT